MTTSALKTTLLTTLLVLPPAALLRAQDAPPAPSVAPAPPAAPVPPAPLARHRTKQREIIVDGGRVFVEDPERMAGFDEFDDEALPMAMSLGRAGFIGVRPVEMTPELREHFGAPRDAGVFVGSVEPDGPAAKAGLQVGDIVTKVEGDRIASTGELVRAVRHRKGGETITVELFRNRSAKSLTVTVAERRDGEIRVGEMKQKIKDELRARDGNWSWAPAPSSELPQLEQRLEELEKKLQSLEQRMPSR